MSVTSLNQRWKGSTVNQVIFFLSVAYKICFKTFKTSFLSVSGMSVFVLCRNAAFTVKNSKEEVNFEDIVY